MTNGEKIKEIFPNGVLTSINNSYYWGDDILVGKSFWNAEYKEPNKSEIPTGSTTKNDLVVDCISREQALRELKESAEHHANDSREEVLLRRDRDIIRALPPVTPIRPKGHWKLVQRGKCIDVCCSNCKAVRIKEYAYNYTIDQLDKEDVKECFESDDMRYCPYCGSDNREVVRKYDKRRSNSSSENHRSILFTRPFRPV